MGFWQGVNEGLTFVMEEKARKKELEQAREDRKSEFQQQIDLEETRYKRGRQDQLADEKRSNSQQFTNALIDYKVKADEEVRAAKTITDNARQLITRLGDANPELSQALIDNPIVADQLGQRVLAAEKKAQESGHPVVYSGKPLADLIDYSKETNQATLAEPAPINYEPKDIQEFLKAREAIASSIPKATISAVLKPEIDYIPDETVLKKGEEVVKQKVLDLATRDLKATGQEDPNDPASVAQSKKANFNTLDAAMKSFTDENSPGYKILMDRYGLQAYTQVRGMDNPYTIGIEKNPLYQDYENILTAQAMLASPYGKDPEVRKTAVGILMNYGLQGPLYD